VGKAVKKLKEMDDYLKKRGLQHLIFITPGFSQVVESAPKDALVNKLLKDNSLNPYYILDELPQYNLSKIKKDKLFHDGVHLEKEGHEIWAQIVR
jgi:hypothetical protein